MPKGFALWHYPATRSQTETWVPETVIHCFSINATLYIKFDMVPFTCDSIALVWYCPKIQLTVWYKLLSKVLLRGIVQSVPGSLYGWMKYISCVDASIYDRGLHNMHWYAIRSQLTPMKFNWNKSNNNLNKNKHFKVDIRLYITQFICLFFCTGLVSWTFQWRKLDNKVPHPQVKFIAVPMWPKTSIFSFGYFDMLTYLQALLVYNHWT